jgi:hypothetical protein
VQRGQKSPYGVTGITLCPAYTSDNDADNITRITIRAVEYFILFPYHVYAKSINKINEENMNDSRQAGMT